MNHMSNIVIRRYNDAKNAFFNCFRQVFGLCTSFCWFWCDFISIKLQLASLSSYSQDDCFCRWSTNARHAFPVAPMPEKILSFECLMIRAMRGSFYYLCLFLMSLNVNRCSRHRLKPNVKTRQVSSAFVDRNVVKLLVASILWCVHNRNQIFLFGEKRIHTNERKNRKKWKQNGNGNENESKRKKKTEKKT